MDPRKSKQQPRRQSSWRHQFLTPKKIRKQRRQQEALKASNSETEKDGQHSQVPYERKFETAKKLLTGTTAENSHKRNDIDAVGMSRSTPDPSQPKRTSNVDIMKLNDKPKSTFETSHQTSNNSISYVTITYEIMRSIVAAIAYIEQNGGFEIKDLYIMSTTRNINKMKVNNTTFHCLQPAVNKCIDLMLKGEIEQIEHFETVFSSFLSHFSFDADDTHKVNVVAMALKGVFNHCESLIPSCIYDKVMNIQDGNEVEKLLSSPNWPNLTSMTFIMLLHHFAKLWKSRVASGHDQNEMIYMTTLAREFGTILLRRRQEHETSCKSDQSRRSFFSKKNISSWIGTKEAKKTSRIYSNREKKDVMMLFISHMTNDQNMNIEEHPSHSRSTQLINECMIDSNDSPEVKTNCQENQSVSVEHKTNILQNDGMKDNTIQLDERLTEGKLDQGHVVEVPQDEAKVEGIDIILNEDVILKARRRLECAELTLKRMESCCLSF